MFLLLATILHYPLQANRAQLDDPPALRPAHGTIIRHVTLRGHLRREPIRDRPLLLDQPRDAIDQIRSTRYRTNVASPRPSTSLTALTPKNRAVAKLTGNGLGSFWNAWAFGCAGRYSASVPSRLALKKASASSPLDAGNPSTVKVAMSVWSAWFLLLLLWLWLWLVVLAPSWNRTARPLGLFPASVSAWAGSPAASEKRAMMGVWGLVRWGAIERERASSVGVKVPFRRMPFAWAVGGDGFRGLAYYFYECSASHDGLLVLRVRHGGGGGSGDSGGSGGRLVREIWFLGQD
ncbi:hypothetical protein VP1G_10581 [Cytospora mali]|uniref:Uncharacterized protein n=1 Tax=Cytospora mali TaxID=578113 RepID=A0A194UPU1_CYTMA|nr:hypothetical protein VP1G_10581 [Valsa mali var. pyri (nom. inval.)]